MRDESVVVTHARRTLMQTFVALRKKKHSHSHFPSHSRSQFQCRFYFQPYFFCFGSWFRNLFGEKTMELQFSLFRARFEFNCFGGRIDHTEIRKHCGAPKTEIPEQVRISLQRRFQNFWQLSLVTSSVADILHFFPSRADLFADQNASVTIDADEIFVVWTSLKQTFHLQLHHLIFQPGIRTHVLLVCYFLPTINPDLNL